MCAALYGIKMGKNRSLFGLFICSVDASRKAQHGVRARCSLALHLDGLRDCNYLEEIASKEQAEVVKWVWFWRKGSR